MSVRAVALVSNRLDAAGVPWEIFICRACGLLYDEAAGDADSGLAAGTRFADIPNDWACPLCGVTKADFEPYVTEALVPKVRKTSATGLASASRRHDAGSVIVGAGRAGWQMAQALRERDADMPITLITSCSGDVYDKPLLSVAISRGIAPDRLTREAASEAAQRFGVKLLADTSAVRIVPDHRQLRTSRGTLRYRHLILAHGAEARSLPELPAALCWRINHLQAYAKFRALLCATPQRIAIVGAGLIGSELANDLALAGHVITLIDRAERPLAACAPPERSQELLAAWKPLPITFVGGLQVAHVQQVVAQARTAKVPAFKKITSQCGRMFEVDHIIVAAGLQTPARLAESAGLTWNNGIDVTAETLTTSVVGIYALGDCIAIGGQVSRFIEPIARQAQTIAAAITGGDARPYRPGPVPIRVKTSSLPFTI